MYGSGYFGEWIEDEFGLPAYRYTCDQINDPKAISPVNEIWRIKTEHLHQVGNDRLVGVASNYGYIQIRQDEGAPKFLNDHAPEHDLYAGGFGYLTDGETILSTFYPGNGESFDRIFGMGYYRKIVTGKGLSADQIIFAPYGDDPLLISQVTIINNREKPVDLRWIEYWGCQMYQFSFKSFIMGVASKLTVPELRRRFSNRFEHHFSPIENYGIIEKKRFKGLKFSTKLGWAIINFFLATFYRKLTGGRIKSPVKQASLDDISPPPTFLISLDSPADGLSTDVAKFFGRGGIVSPEGLHEPLSSELKSQITDTGMLLERKLHLEPGEKQTLYFAYGYLPEGFEIQDLITKYKENLPELLAQSCSHWKKDRIKLVIKDEPWIDRELQWHNYYLRGNLTYDSFFKEHILSQGHVYQYIIGFQGAARDPLQHTLPFIYCEPTIVKEILRYTLKTVSPKGEIPYAITGHGMYMPSPFKPSDLELWLLWVLSEYVLATRDLAFLEEELPTYPLYGKKAGKAKVKEIAYRCYTHLTKITGIGTHGLLRLSNGDWNDMVVHGFVPKNKVKKVTKYAETVLNSAMASFALDIYSQLLQYANESDKANEVKTYAESLRAVVHEQWTGNWFKRAWLTEDLGWIGIDELWLEPQPWAFIGGAVDQAQKEKLLENIDQKVRQPSKIGALILDKPLKKMIGAPGVGTNAGIWPSINGTLIWALSLVDAEIAWDEWKKNTLAAHAEAYPEVWYGIWSGPDTYNSEFSKYPGQTIFISPDSSEEEAMLGIKINWTDFPVMNMHPHAWPLYTITKLIGIKFTIEGVEITPTLPKEEYHFSSPLIGLEKSSESYSGWYAPKISGTWKMTLNLAENEAKLFKTLIVNGKEEPILREAGKIIFKGASKPDKPLQWSLKK